jgi:ATP-dependent Clp protease ATP-binding subunit ClpA
MLSDLADGLKGKGISVEFTEELKNYIVEKGYDEKYGARPLRRVIAKEIESTIAQMYIKSEVKAGDVLGITAADNNVVFIKGGLSGKRVERA